MPERGGGSAGSRKKRRAERAGAGRDLRAGHAPRSRPGLPERPDWLRQALTGGFLVGILIATLGFNYISNSGGGTAATSVLWTSLVSLKSSTSGISYGLLAMILTSWFVGSVLVASEATTEATTGVATENHAAPGGSALGKTLLTVLGVSLLLGLFFWLWHSSGLASIAKQTAGNLQDVLAQIGRYENLLTRYTFFLLLAVFGMAAFLPAEPLSRIEPAARRGAVLAPFALVIALALAATTNLRIIQADIAFKLAEPFARGNTYPVAIAVYNRANDLAPTEDYYYLFLGRAYLDYSRTLTDANERERLIAQAAGDLRKAQELSPLNTDHTANLARLYSLWASYSNDPQVRAERAQTSSDYFNRALVLSPNNARIWDEWALLYLNILEKPDEAFERLDHAVKIDPFYDWTYGLMGEYYTRRAREISAGQEEQKQAALDQAAEAYQQALQLASPVDTQNKYSYALALGGVEIQRGQTDQAIAAYQQAIETIPNSQEIWRIEEAIARIYFEKGDVQNALAHAQAALAAAPDDQKERLTTMVTQWQGQ